MAKPNLLLCFDAFGTLFRPKQTVWLQYKEVAQLCGITGFTDQELQSTLGKAIKDEAKRHPNYGKVTGLGATQWWTNVIHNTFTPFLKNNEAVPRDLAPKLLHRFSSNEGYEAEPNLAASLRTLKSGGSRRHFDKIVIGVVTNSDDRVPDILSSFGLSVSPLRYGTEECAQTTPTVQRHDIDFHCISYDVGVEKPDKPIFDAALHMLTRLIAAEEGKDLDEAKSDAKKWQKVYVGDEYAKDVIGSQDAGWNSLLLDTAGESSGIPELKDFYNGTVEEMFEAGDVWTVDSIQHLAEWLSGRPNNKANV